MKRVLDTSGPENPQSFRGICPGCLDGALKQRFDLLSEISRRVQAINAPSGDDNKSNGYNFTGCDVFAIFGQEDAISMTHHDHRLLVTRILGLKMLWTWTAMLEVMPVVMLLVLKMLGVKMPRVKMPPLITPPSIMPPLGNHLGRCYCRRKALGQLA